MSQSSVPGSALDSFLPDAFEHDVLTVMLAPPKVPAFAASTIPAPPPVKVCGCSRTYDASEWESLPLVGEMDDGAGGRLVLRNCPAPCMSTLAIEVTS